VQWHRQQQAEATSILKAKTHAHDETRVEIDSLEAESASLKNVIDKERASMMSVIQVCG
jgi:hypothetical protein